jgi:hypothetical protein
MSSKHWKISIKAICSNLVNLIKKMMWKNDFQFWKEYSSISIINWKNCIVSSDSQLEEKNLIFFKLDRNNNITKWFIIMKATALKLDQVK